MNKQYKFSNRYGEARSFTKEDDRWFLEGQSHYTRIGGDDTENPVFIDPDGGPFLQIGTKFRNYAKVDNEDDLEITGFKFDDVSKRWELLTRRAKETKA
jgi:hypothetical protein